MIFCMERKKEVRIIRFVIYAFGFGIDCDRNSVTRVRCFVEVDGRRYAISDTPKRSFTKRAPVKKKSDNRLTYASAFGSQTEMVIDSEVLVTLVSMILSGFDVAF